MRAECGPLHDCTVGRRLDYADPVRCKRVIVRTRLRQDSVDCIAASSELRLRV